MLTLGQLKGGDSLLYHALKLYKLAPELRWTAGGYIWALDQVVDLAPSEADDGSPTGSGRIPFAVLNGTRSVASPLRSSFSTASESGEDDMRTRVKKSGAVALTDAEIVLLSDASLGPVSKERVFFVQGGELEKLVVNILLVVYVP